MANMESYSNKNSMSPAYVDLLQKNFITDVSNIEEVDFARNSVKVTEHINKWVSEQTNGMISELFKEPIDRSRIKILSPLKLILTKIFGQIFYPTKDRHWSSWRQLFTSKRVGTTNSKYCPPTLKLVFALRDRLTTYWPAFVTM